MDLHYEFQPIRDWAQEKGIYDKGDPKTQYIKLMEEMGELAMSLLKNNDDDPNLYSLEVIFASPNQPTVVFNGPESNDDVELLEPLKCINNKSLL
jgi:hypothetical protein